MSPCACGRSPKKTDFILEEMKARRVGLLAISMTMKGARIVLSMGVHFRVSVRDEADGRAVGRGKIIVV